MEKEIRKTLKSILEYIGADISYADNAQLQTYMENLIKTAKKDTSQQEGGKAGKTIRRIL